MTSLAKQLDMKVLVSKKIMENVRTKKDKKKTN